MAPAARVSSLVLLICALVPAGAQAVQLGEAKPGSALSGAKLQVVQSLYYKYNFFLDEDPDDDVEAPFGFHEFVSRTYADFQIKQWSVGAQMDWVAVTPNCSQTQFQQKFSDRFGDAACSSPNPILGSGTNEWGPMALDHFLFQLEKAWVRYRGKNVQFGLGDFSIALGRGLTLSMTRKPEIDLDNTLRGARFDVLTKPFDMTLMAGITNPQDVSMELRNLLIKPEPFHLIAGGRVKVRPAPGMEVTVHGLGIDLEDPEHKNGAIGGTFSASNLADGTLDLFIEGDGFFYGGREVGDEIPPTGHALYGVATAYLGALTLQLEGKRYKDAMHNIQPGPVVPLQYNLPPSLEHEPSVTEDINKSILSNDITGLRLRGDVWLLSSDTTITADFATHWEGQPHPGFSGQREFIIHPTLGIDQPLHLGKDKPVELHIAADVGYRHDFPVRFKERNVPDRVATRDGWETEFLPMAGVLHYRVDVGVTAGIHSVELVSTYRRQHRTLAEEVCWERNGTTHCDMDDGWIALENSLSYTLMGKYTAALNVDYTDDIRVQAINARGSPGNLFYDPDFKASAYIGGTLIIKPVSNFELNVFGGSQKAGIVCTGGACRTVPAFTGVKARATISF